jgi:hypothetical protein
VSVHPSEQIVEPMSAWVTAGLTAPGVHRRSGSTYKPVPRTRQGPEPESVGTGWRAAAPVVIGGVVLVVLVGLVGLVGEGGEAVVVVVGAGLVLCHSVVSSRSCHPVIPAMSPHRRRQVGPRFGWGLQEPGGPKPDDYQENATHYCYSCVTYFLSHRSCRAPPVAHGHSPRAVER